MAVFKRLSERDGKAEPDDGPFESVPPHLIQPLWGWLQKLMITYDGSPSQSMLEYLALRLRLQLRVGESSYKAMDDLTKLLNERPPLLLDVIDALLYPGTVGIEELGELGARLDLGGSVWRVDDDGQSLVRRQDPEVDAAAQVALSPNDAASAELKLARAAAFGREPDPSDAWDHAIKAVEHLMLPIVIPKVDQGTLGQAIGTLRGASHTWETELGTVDNLLDALGLIWANPDRHGNANQRPPTQEEAEAVVHLAVTLVQWLRSGYLRRR